MVASVVLAALAACSPGPPDAATDVVLRVSGFDVMAMDPDLKSGTSVYAKDLVYLRASGYLAEPTLEGNRLVFQPLPAKRLSVEAIAQAMVGTAIQRVDVVSGAVVATLKPGEAPPPLDKVLLDLGPFRQLEYTPGKLVLARRSGTGLSRIEFVDVHSEDEEWRRFLGREIDCVPSVRSSYVRYLSEVPSVRLIPVEQPLPFGILFWVADGPYADRRIRRAISFAIRRNAVAKVAVGSAELAANVQEDADEARRLVAAQGAAEPLKLIVMRQLTESTRAALVVEQQLSEVGITVTLDALDISVAGERIVTKTYGMILLAAGYQPFFYRRVLSGHPDNITGYANPEFDKAVAAGDDARAVRILGDDVPMTPLYTAPDAVALDRRFCGAHPKVAYDLSWLADVHLCVQGETE